MCQLRFLFLFCFDNGLGDYISAAREKQQCVGVGWGLSVLCGSPTVPLVPTLEKMWLLHDVEKRGSEGGLDRHSSAHCYAEGADLCHLPKWQFPLPGQALGFQMMSAVFWEQCITSHCCVYN